MSRDWFNFRFGSYHWQWGPDGMTFRHNPYHANWRNNPEADGKWFSCYCAFGKHYF